MTVMKKCRKSWMKSCLMIVLTVVLPLGGAWIDRPDQGTALIAPTDLMVPVVTQSAATRMALEENPDTDTELKNDTTDVDKGMMDDTTDADKGMQNDTTDVDKGMQNDTGDVDTDMQATD
jgi:hypothetical protein